MTKGCHTFRTPFSLSPMCLSAVLCWQQRPEEAAHFIMMLFQKQKDPVHAIQSVYPLNGHSVFYRSFLRTMNSKKRKEYSDGFRFQQ